MSDQTAATSGDPGPGSSPPRIPRWVKWPAIILGVLIVLFLVLRLFGVEHGTGQHGPQRHMPGGGNPPASAPAHGGDHG